MTAVQLDFEGNETPLAKLRPRSAAELTQIQKAILREARFVYGGTIRPVQAGVLVHRARADSCATWMPTAKRISCCKYASRDGLAAIHRLEARGLLERVCVGLYAVLP